MVAIHEKVQPLLHSVNKQNLCLISIKNPLHQDELVIVAEQVKTNECGCRRIDPMCARVWHSAKTTW